MKRLFLALALALAPFVSFADAFKPIDNSTIAVSASTSNATGTFTAAPTGPDFQVRVYNSCSTTAFIRLGAAATTSNIPIPTTVVEVYTVPAFTTTVGVILASGSGCSVYFTLGRGD